MDTPVPNAQTNSDFFAGREPSLVGYATAENRLQAIDNTSLFHVETSGNFLTDTTSYVEIAGHHDRSLIEQIIDDHRELYSSRSLFLLNGGLAIGGLMANTTVDRNVQRHFQSSVRSANSDDWFETLHAGKELRNGIYVLPVYGVCWAIGDVFPESALAQTSGRWGGRTLRGFLVGSPPLLIAQRIVGGSRPTESDEGSEWGPFADNNGISGHSFMGSLPLITAAQMSESLQAKAFFYAASTVVPLSRINDNAHYPSQAILGWYFAFLAARAVSISDGSPSRFRLIPYATGSDSGLLAELQF